MLQSLILFLFIRGLCTSISKKSSSHLYVHDAQASQFYSFHSHQANQLLNYLKVYLPTFWALLPDLSDSLAKILLAEKTLRFSPSAYH